MRELWQFGFRSGVGTFARERADVQLVNDLPLERHTAPRIVGPFEGAGIDDLGWTMRPFGLKPRRRIRVAAFVVAHFILVARAGGGVGDAAEVAVVFGPQFGRRAADGHRDARRSRRPDAKMGAPAADWFGADGKPA